MYPTKEIMSFRYLYLKGKREASTDLESRGFLVVNVSTLTPGKDPVKVSTLTPGKDPVRSEVGSEVGSEWDPFWD
jgi:hypothetical protein